MSPRGTKGAATREAAYDLLAQGLTVKEVAARMGCTNRTVERAKKDLGLTNDRGGANRMTEQDKALILTHLDDGASLAEIHRTTGWTHDTLRRHFPGRAWNRKQVGEHAAIMRRYGARL